MDALSKMRDVIVGLYEMMCNVHMNIFGLSCTLWDLYLYGFFAMVGVFIFWKVIRS